MTETPFSGSAALARPFVWRLIRVLLAVVLLLAVLPLAPAFGVEAAHDKALPSITVEKTPARITVTEPGESVSFTVTVTSTSVPTDVVTITSLVDDVFGDLDGRGTCVLPQTLDPDDSYTCSFSGVVAGNAGTIHTNTVTAAVIDDDGDTAEGSDDATVTVVDALPSLVVTKTASPTEILEPERFVRFFVDVTNTSVSTDPLTLLSLQDDVFADLDGKGTCSVPQLIPPGGTYSCQFDVIIAGAVGFVHHDTVTATAEDDENNIVSAQDDATVTVIGAEPTIDVVKTASPSSVPEPGGDVTFTVSITNTSFLSDPITIETLVDDVHGDLDGRGTCSVPQLIVPEATYQCAFTAFVGGDAGDTETDTVTATGVDDEGMAVEGSDSAIVTISDVVSTITVTKTATPTSVVEPGGDVEFALTVRNDSEIDDFTLTSLVDDVHGDLDGQGTCGLPQTLAPGATYACSFTAFVAGDAGDAEVDTVTASGTDSDGVPLQDSDSATVTVSDVAPVISVTKVADPTSVAEPGGPVTFTVGITNESAATDPVTITSLVDDVHGDVADSGTCELPVTIDPGDTYTCEFTADVLGNAGTTEVDVVTASGTDDDGTPVAGQASATVTITNVVPVITVTKSASAESVDEPGAVVDFTVTVTNDSVTTDPVTITSIVDSAFGDILDSGNAAVVSTDCAAVTITPGDTYTCGFAAFVAGNAGGVHSNTVTVTGLDDEESQASDEDSASVGIDDLPSAITVDKTAGSAVVPETGGDVTYTVVVTNTSVADDVTITSLTDDIFGDVSGGCSPALPVTLVPGASLTCQFTENLSGTAGDEHTNVVTATGVDDDQGELEASDDATVTFTPVIDLELAKSADPGVVEVGETTTFTLTVTNQGPADATGVVVTDTLPAGLEIVSQDGGESFDAVDGVWTVGSLAAGASIDLSLTVTVTEAETFTNVAEVTAADQGDADSTPGDGQGDDYATADVVGFEVLASAVIGDTVFLDTDLDGTQDSGENGIANVTVRLTNLDTNATASTTTDADGKYLFAALEAGNYRVDVVRPSSTLAATTPESFTVTLSDGQSFLTADFGFAESLPRTGLDAEVLAILGLLLVALGLGAVTSASRQD